MGLILHRKQSEAVQIRCQCGCEMIITPTLTMGNAVKLRFDGPLDMRVERIERDAPTPPATARNRHEATNV
ncbi:hypothetical protein KOR42_39940 [Thalassoglobus neptunius]|uniref:Carbon storage regulator n=1 Tax=Thalassoglobus neptunius TaxID=1938619 RepID=A0A5C5WC30_9PLAN|nr:carbon storage regulator [Thalassoglobus neptunius]TWT48204.1 hypothetical protein KOR42_39940 [Thalassoglobus neptunius]